MSEWDAEFDPLIPKMIRDRAARLSRQFELGSPTIIIDNEWRMLSEAYYRWKVLQGRKEHRRNEEADIEGEV